MVDKKISALTSLTGANTAADDEIPIVDKSAVETKKQTVAEHAIALQARLSKTGSDTDLVTGTSGTNGNVGSWNADGDLVDSGVAVTDIGDLKGATAQEFTAAKNFNATTLTDAASIAWNLNTNQVAEVTLADNRALANPTNQKAGGTYILIVKQDATGNRTLSYGSAYKFPAGEAPVLSTAANAIDVLSFVSDGTNMLGVAAKAFS